MGASVCNLVKQSFNDNSILNEIKMTLIVLIPRVDQPSSLKMYRPVSLCRMIYKTITKIMANRLKAILLSLIGST